MVKVIYQCDTEIKEVEFSEATTWYTSGGELTVENEDKYLASFASGRWIEVWIEEDKDGE